MSLPEHLADLERRIRARYDGAVAGLRHEYEARLRRASEELLAALGEVRAPELEPLAGIDVAAFTPRPSDREETLGDLLAGARAFDAAAGQAEVLDALLEAARRFAERAGLLLLRADGATGWASAGFDGDPFAGRELAWDDSLPAPALAARGAVRLDTATARRFAERLGFASPAASAVLVPLVLRDQVAAALYADAAGAGPEPPLAALQLLVQLAAARLELQPLSERGYSPTLYESDAAPAAALALWSSVPPPPAVEPVAPVAEVVAPAVAAAPAWLEPALEPPAPAPALPPPAVPTSTWSAPEAPPVEPVREAPAAPTPWWSAPEPAPPAVEPTFEPVFEPAPEPVAEPEPGPVFEPAPEPAAPPASEPVESLFVAAPAGVEVPAAAPAFEPAATPEAPVPALEDSLWGTGAQATDAAEAGFAVEPEPPPVAPQFAAEPALGDATVRIPAYRPSPAPPPAPVEEPPAALDHGTRRMPQFLAPPPAAPVDATEDATVLMRGATAPIPIPPVPPAVGDEEPGERTGVRIAARTTEVAPPPDVSGPGLAFAAGRAVRTVGENALHDEARRLARLLVSEIKLYNEEQVLEGRRNRDLYMRLKEDIDRSRQIYDERVHESVRSTTDYFHQELVRSLAGGDSRALGL